MLDKCTNAPTRQGSPKIPENVPRCYVDTEPLLCENDHYSHLLSLLVAASHLSTYHYGVESTYCLVRSQDNVSD